MGDSMAQNEATYFSDLQIFFCQCSWTNHWLPWQPLTHVTGPAGAPRKTLRPWCPGDPPNGASAPPSPSDYGYVSGKACETPAQIKLSEAQAQHGAQSSVGGDLACSGETSPSPRTEEGLASQKRVG